MEQKLFLEKKNLFLKKITSEILWSEVWKGGFQLMLMLVLLGMYCDAVVGFVTKSSLLFKLAVAILWFLSYKIITYEESKFQSSILSLLPKMWDIAVTLFNSFFENNRCGLFGWLKGHFFKFVGKKDSRLSVFIVIQLCPPLPSMT